jgi:hypothetical protein
VRLVVRNRMIALVAWGLLFSGAGAIADPETRIAAVESFLGKELAWRFPRNEAQEARLRSLMASLALLLLKEPLPETTFFHAVLCVGAERHRDFLPAIERAFVDARAAYVIMVKAVSVLPLPDRPPSCASAMSR